MKFLLEIELGNEGMQTGEDIRLALENAAERWNQGTVTEPQDLGDGRIFDTNGNTVGKWEVTESKPNNSDTLRRLVRLNDHPLFHQQTELPAWSDVIAQAREELSK